jgi:hypothetical protein
MPRLNERKRGEAIRFLLRGEDQISAPEQIHVSQSSLSRLRRRMLTTESLKNYFRSDRPRVTARRQDQKTPLLHKKSLGGDWPRWSGYRPWWSADLGGQFI